MNAYREGRGKSYPLGMKHERQVSAFREEMAHGNLVSVVMCRRSRKGWDGHRGNAGSTGSQAASTRGIKLQDQGTFSERPRNRHGNQEEAVWFGRVSSATRWGPISLYCARYVDGTEINVCSDGWRPTSRRLE